MATAPISSVKKLILWQAVVFLVLVMAFSFKDSTAQLSVFLGGLLAAIPALIFVRHALRFVGAKQAKLVVRSFYLGEALKLISCAIGFALVFEYVPSVNLAALWLGFVLQLILPTVLAATGQIAPQFIQTKRLRDVT